MPQSERNRYRRPKFYQGIASLEQMGKSGIDMQETFLVRQLFPKKREMHFNRKWIKLGIIAKPSDSDYRKDANDYMLSTDAAFRALMLGAAGSGKTMTMQGMATRMHYSGFACVFLTDIKDEMKVAANPAAGAKIVQVLEENGDVPMALPVKVYRPLFFSKFFRESVPKDNHSLQLAYRDLNLSELLTLLGLADDSKRNQRDIITNHYKKADSLEELREIVNKKVTGSNKSIADSITRALDPLIELAALGKEPVGDFVEDMKAGLVPVLNVHKYERVGIGSATLPQVYVSVLLRKIVEAREHGAINRRIVLFIDEAPKFFVPGTLTFDELLKAVDLYRYLGIYLVFAAQTDDRIPPALVEQCRYIFLPFNAGAKTARRVLAAKQNFMWHPDQIEQIDARMRRMKIDFATGMRQWALVDADRKSADIFWALPALSSHAEPKA